MAHYITDECLVCGACAEACPFSAIVPAENGDGYEVNASMCVDCGACEDICPVYAVLPE